MCQNNLFLTAITCTLLLVLPACHVKKANPTENNTLVIASDYLVEGDTSLFKGFSAQNKARVVIRPITTDALIGLMRNEGYNSGIDLVLSESSHSAFRLWQEKLLQPVYEKDAFNNADNDYISYKYSYVSLGIDPFVIYYPSDTLITARTYQDLFKTPHSYSLTREDILSFLSPLRQYKNQVDTYSWIERWDSTGVQQSQLTSHGDTLPAILTRHSHVELLRDSLKGAGSDKLIFPNGLRRGSYYDVLPMAIVNQAENYIMAKKFIQYYTNPGHNSIINEKLHTFPLYDYLESRSVDFKLNPANKEALLQYHPMIERIVNKLD